jgi:hypothetical protein
MEHTELARMGGKARAAKLTDQERSHAAWVAVTARWDRVRAARVAVVLKAKKRKRAGGRPQRLS